MSVPLKVLAIDTSASLCAACVWQDGEEPGRYSIDIGKGHAEHLMAVIDAALGAAGNSFQEIDRVVIAVGPGSFTGIRVGVATARGLALALKIPAVGVSNLEAVAAETAVRHPDQNVMAVFSSANDMVQAAVYDPFAKFIYAPETMSTEYAVQLARNHAAVVTGSGIAAIQALAPELVADGNSVTADVATYARIGSAKEPAERPKPLYLREPDAKPQAGFVLPRASA